MLVNEALEAYKATSTAISGPNKEWNAHLKKESVWGAAKSYVTQTIGVEVLLTLLTPEDC